MKTRSVKVIKSLLVVILLLTLTGPSRADEWNPVTPPDSPDARFGHTMVNLPDGCVLIFGGEDESNGLCEELFRFADDRWEIIHPENDPPPPRRDHRAWLRGENMLVYGGLGESGPLDDLWQYDPAANTWTELPIQGSMRPLPRRGHSATPLPDGSVLILGGINELGLPLRDIWRLNPDRTFTPLTPCPIPYSYHSAHVVNFPSVGDCLVVFGFPGSLAIYNILNNTWSNAPAALPLVGYASTAEGRNPQGERVVFIFGGQNEDGTESDVVYEYNTVTMQVTARDEPMPFPWMHGAVAPLLAGQAQGRAASFAAATSDDLDVLVFGGLSGGVPISSTLHFAPEWLIDFDLTGPGMLVGAPGEIVTHTVVITNTGTLSDTYDLALGASAWTTTLPFTRTVVVSPSLAIAVPVGVAIPVGAAVGDGDAVTLTATSVYTPTVTRQLTLWTVVPYRVHLPLVLRQ